MQNAPSDEVPVLISAEHLEPELPKDSRIDLEKGMSYAAWLTITTAVLCVVVFAWELATNALENERTIVAAGALTRTQVLDGEIWRLLTSMFLHGGFDHLIGNLLALYVLGIACEHTIGRGRMTIVYLLTGLSGGILTLCLDDRPTVGASGAIFGLMGFMATLLFRHRKRIMMRENRIAIVLVVWAAYQLIMGFLSPLVANWAHIGGLVSGAALGLIISSRRFAPG